MICQNSNSIDGIEPVTQVQVASEHNLEYLTSGQNRKIIGIKLLLEKTLTLQSLEYRTTADAGQLHTL